MKTYYFRAENTIRLLVIRALRLSDAAKIAEENTNLDDGEFTQKIIADINDPIWKQFQVEKIN